MGPVFAKFFEDQNELRKKGLLPSSILEIKLATLGIINGFIDQKIQMPFYPKFANNNTSWRSVASDIDIEFRR